MTFQLDRKFSLFFGFATLIGCLIGWQGCMSDDTATTSTFAELGSEDANRALPDVVDFVFHVKPILSDRCFACHGPDANTREADLALHTPELAYAALGKNLDRHAIIPGNPDSSTLVARLYTTDPDDIMPPPETNLTVSEYEKKILTKWIEQGAVYKDHWAFVAPEKPKTPSLTAEAKNEIDNFVIKRLQQDGLQLSEQETPEVLLRRASFALTGLPPSADQLDDFLNDPSDENYEQIIDDILESDVYAERMAQIWMDIARYADTHGYQDDLERFQWPWRDWVIHAYKENMPYDQFVTWQLAGDMLPESNIETVIASAFNRNHKITYEGGVIPEEYRVEYVADRAQTFGTAFLGLTVECARCHDHKYDPFSQENYFSLFSFFNNVPEQGLAQPYGATPEPFITLTKEEMESTVDFINNIDEVEKVELMVMEEMNTPRQAYILNRGQYDQPTTPVEPNTPEAILPFGDRPKNRLGLAEWLFDDENPLTARVAVNRLWQQVFGKGIVESAYDFGNQGSLPTHPELLDYLAIEYRDKGWDTKAILKKMVMSATFRQSAETTPELLERDPENRLLARASRIRLNAEMIRDQALFAAGLLNQDVGGQSVKPYQPPGLWEETVGGGGDLRTYVQDEGDKLYRRSMYTFWKRTVPPPSMMTFDAASKDLCTVKRQETNTPLQALVLMNDPQIIEAARLLAHEALIEADEEIDEKIAFIFRQTTSREPTDEEVSILMNYYQGELKTFRENPDRAKAYTDIGELQLESDVEIEELAAYSLLANAIINLDEAINRG